MDEVAFADAEIMLIAGMAGILLECDDEKVLRKVFEASIPSAKDLYAVELNKVIQRRRAGESPLTGPAVTREYWRLMISKIYKVFGEAVVREFFEDRTEEVKARRQRERDKTRQNLLHADEFAGTPRTLHRFFKG